MFSTRNCKIIRTGYSILKLMVSKYLRLRVPIICKFGLLLYKSRACLLLK